MALTRDQYKVGDYVVPTYNSAMVDKDRLLRITSLDPDSGRKSQKYAGPKYQHVAARNDNKIALSTFGHMKTFDENRFRMANFADIQKMDSWTNDAERKDCETWIRDLLQKQIDIGYSPNKKEYSFLNPKETVQDIKKEIAQEVRKEVAQEIKKELISENRKTEDLLLDLVNKIRKTHPEVFPTEDSLRKGVPESKKIDPEVKSSRKIKDEEIPRITKDSFENMFNSMNDLFKIPSLGTLQVPSQESFQEKMRNLVSKNFNLDSKIPESKLDAPKTIKVEDPKPLDRDSLSKLKNKIERFLDSTKEDDSNPLDIKPSVENQHITITNPNLLPKPVPVELAPVELKDFAFSSLGMMVATLMAAPFFSLVTKALKSVVSESKKEIEPTKEGEIENGNI